MTSDCLPSLSYDRHLDAMSSIARCTLVLGQTDNGGPASQVPHRKCNACCLGKAHRLPYMLYQTTYSQPLELIHSDIWGPSPYTSTNGYKYYVHFTDAYSRYTWFYPLHTKSEVYDVFLSFKKMIELQLNCSIKAFQSDSGAEYLKIGRFLKEHGIIHRLSCPYTHEQNGLAERKHRSITETGLTLLSNASLPFTLWVDAFST